MTEKLTEADIETKCIEPALNRAGWDVTSSLVHKQFPITKGRIIAKARFFTPDELAALNYDFDKCCPFPHEEETILPPAELIADYQAKRTALNAKIDALLAQTEGKLGGEA